ncbi:hypothetical protein [Actinoplanes sp. NPDC048796]|uniref:hypothetical protein n=1 Tax=Actinoplanes sp. NPDC048796 TaxID=3155640 RepID=UPI0033DBB0EC
MTPAQLRARAALWSLRAALAALEARALDEAQHIAAEEATTRSLLKSPTWGRRRALGGHADPVAGAIDAPELVRVNQWSKTQADVIVELRGVAEHLPGLAGPLDRLQAAVPHMSDRMADGTRLFADRIDGRVRRKLVIHADRLLVPRALCPTCDTTGLTMRLSPPAEERVIECTTCGGAWLRNEALRSVAA